MILVTGGAGFIGSNFVKMLCDKGEDVIVLDNMTYAANEKYLDDLGIIRLIRGDIADDDLLNNIFSVFDIDTVFNFAAESHVDNSIKDCMPFIHSNIIGTVNLLKHSVNHGVKLFVQISTDEVFGSTDTNWFDEMSQIHPNNPYSASKASAEHFVNAYANTYGLKTIIVNCSNNYGPHQHIEKLIPKAISNLINDEKVPVYGDGSQIRDWLYVEDTCDALWAVYTRGRAGERYCIGGNTEIKNVDLIKIIIDIMGKSHDNIEFVDDRPGHDRRYATNTLKMRAELGWSPRTTLSQGLIKTIQWYTNDENRI